MRRSPLRSGLIRPALLFGLALLSACAGTGSGGAERGPWQRGFTPPDPPTTARFQLQPLGPELAELDHAAIVSSREHLRATFHGGDWPQEGYTIEDARRDLTRQAAEFRARRAYGYAVLSPDRSLCLGGVHLQPIRATRGQGEAAELLYWVVAREIPTGLDTQVLDAVLDWLAAEWTFAEVLLPLRVENRRGASVARAAGLEELRSPVYGYRLFRWERP